MFHPQPDNQRRDLARVGSLDFDEHPRFSPASTQHLPQRRDLRVKPPNLRQRFVAHPATHTTDSAEAVIVEYNQFAITRFLHVDFHQVDAQLKRGSHGRKRVLRVTTAETAMRDDQRPRCHGRLRFHSST